MINIKRKRLLSIICLISIIFLIFGKNVSFASKYKIQDWIKDDESPLGSIVISVEKFSLNQGYLIEPLELPFYEGDTGSVLVDRLLGKDNYKNTGSVKDSFYLARVYDPTMEEINFPKHIIENSRELSNTRSDEWLGEFDYYSMSGWMYSVNGWFPNYGFSQYVPKDGDVIRVQFTVSGYGADIGANNEQWGQPDYIKFANKNPLTKLIGRFNTNKSKSDLLENSEIKEAYYKALEVLTKIDASENEVKSAQENMINLLDGIIETSDISNNKIEVQPEKIVNKNKFVDIDDYGWAKDSLDYLVENNIIKGKTSDLFDPSAKIKRADFAILLSRALNLDSDSKEIYSNFKDIHKDNYYYKAINLVINEGLMEGSNGYFNPNSIITREEIAKILSKVIYNKEIEEGILSEIKDKNEISEEYIDGVEKVLSYKIMNIDKVSRFKPKKAVTRIEAAVILKRLLDLN